MKELYRESVYCIEKYTTLDERMQFLNTIKQVMPDLIPGYLKRPGVSSSQLKFISHYSIHKRLHHHVQNKFSLQQLLE